MEKITGIKIDNPNYLGINKNHLEELSPISKINIFVGANNSGKSRLLRSLFSINNYEVKIERVDLRNKLSQINSCLEEIENGFKSYNINSANEFTIDNIQELKLVSNYFYVNSDIFDQYRDKIANLTRFPKILSVEGDGANGFSQSEILRNIITQNAQEIGKILNLIPADLGLKNLKRFYIPVLRGLRPISDDKSKNYYQDQTVKDYFSNQEEKKDFIYSGLDFYERLKDLLLGKSNDRQLITDYQNFLSSTLFEEKNIELIPNQLDQTVYVQIGSEEYPIHNLGDGIQSIIILTFLPFITQEPAFFFIEEPELFLHPGMQRKIMEFFSSNKGNLNLHTFFLTTHSNHFLDLTIDFPDVSIFNFRKQFPIENVGEKESTFIVQAVDIGDRSSLECLGVRNSSVFLVNATIWVEGITDRWYLREMLRQYIDIHKEDAGFLKIEEDVHYSFVEYGGSNITHWSFLDFKDNIAVETLCGKAFVIVDRDDPNKKLERKDELDKKLGKRLKILEAREIENTLPSIVIRQVIAEYENKNLDEIPDFSDDDYQYEPLGEFIDEKLGTDKKRKASYQTESGTIAGKVAFCNKALPYIKFEELPKQTKELIELIYNHIKNQNKLT